MPLETCSELAFHFTYKSLILFTESARYLAQKLTFPLTPMFAHDIPRYPKGGVSRRDGRDAAGLGALLNTLLSFRGAYELVAGKRRGEDVQAR